MDKSELHHDNVALTVMGQPSSSPSPSTQLEQQHRPELASLASHRIADIPHRPNNNGPFAFTPDELMALIDPKSPGLLEQYGGPEGIIAGLHSDPVKGLSTSGMGLLETVVEGGESGKQSQKPLHNDVDTTVVSFSEREQYFGRNVLPKRKPKSIFQLMWMALHEKILILLLVAAVVAIGLGFYEDYGMAPEEDVVWNEDFTSYTPEHKRISWVEGVAILAAVFIVVMVGSINDYQKEAQFRKLNAKKEDREVKALRNGETVLLSVFDIVVGDILHLEPGDIIAADGIYLGGHNLKCDESSVNGEADAVKKVTFEELKRLEEAEASRHVESQIQTNHEGIEVIAEPVYAYHGADPFIISGSKILEGVGVYIVTGVGQNSFHGRTMMSLRIEPEDTPLQVKLNGLAETIAKLGSMAALIMLIVLFIRYFVGFKANGTPPSARIVKSLVDIFIAAVTVVVVAVPEGLPLAVTLALAFATTRMLKDNNLVRVLAACETMGNATTVCSDKTGTLTQNRMTVVAGTIGVNTRFIADVPEGDSNPRQTIPINKYAVPMSQLTNNIPPAVTKLIHEAIAINSSAFESEDDQGKLSFIGSKTEVAMLDFSKKIGGPDYRRPRESAPVEHLYPFSSERKSMATIVRMGPNKFRLHTKGASEIIMRRCDKVLKINSSSDQGAPLSEEDRAADLTVLELTGELQTQVHKTIISYATQSLRTIGIAYRDFESWPPADVQLIDGEVPFAAVAESNLTLIGVVGIEDPLREGVPEAVLACQRAGVFVRMVTGDNILTAKSIATQCGIYTQGGIIMEGPKFRLLSDDEMDAVIPRLQVLARSSPEDKKILVGRLKALGEIVAVTGDGTNDGPALKMSDVGFSMGIAGTEVAKEASSIILMDDNFSSIVKAILWGRTVNDAVKKFLQFQLTVNITAVVLTLLTAAISDNQKPVMSAVQLLWVNLIMDTLAALALATDPPTMDLLDRQPEPRTAPLITFTMWKMIIGQAILQLTVTFVLKYAGMSILNYDEIPDWLRPKIAENEPGVIEKAYIGFKKQELDTMVFNTFVFLQIFNEVNCRRLDNHLNIFSGIQRNNYFVIIFFIMVTFQIIIVEFGGAAFKTEKLDGIQWLICVLLGLLSIPVGVIVRLIPEEIFGSLKGRINRFTPPTGGLPNFEKYPAHDLGHVSSAPGSRESMTSANYPGQSGLVWNSAITKVRSELQVFNAIRGGRMKANSETKNYHALHAGAMVPSLVATSVGAGWTPRSNTQNLSQGDLGSGSPSQQQQHSSSLQGVSAAPTSNSQTPPGVTEDFIQGVQHNVLQLDYINHQSDNNVRHAEYLGLYTSLALDKSSTLTALGSNYNEEESDHLQRRNVRADPAADPSSWASSSTSHDKRDSEEHRSSVSNHYAIRRDFKTADTNCDSSTPQVLGPGWSGTFMSNSQDGIYPSQTRSCTWKIQASLNSTGGGDAGASSSSSPSPSVSPPSSLLSTLPTTLASSTSATPELVESQELTGSPYIVVLNFWSQIQLVCGIDYLTVYDGPDAFSPVITKICGNIAMEHAPSIYSSGPHMTVVFSSQERSPGAFGFVAAWSSVYVPVFENFTPRSQHGMAYDPVKDMVYITGGTSSQYPAMWDLLTYTFATNKWGKINVTTRGPDPRYGHFSFMYNNDLFIYGGITVVGGTAEVWKFNGKQWSLQPSTSLDQLPFGRIGSACVLATVNNATRLVVFGGMNAAGETMRDISIYNMEASVWRKVVHQNSVGLAGASAVYHKATGSIYYFGGMTNNTTRNVITYQYVIEQEMWYALAPRVDPLTSTPVGPSPQSLSGSDDDDDSDDDDSQSSPTQQYLPPVWYDSVSAVWAPAGLMGDDTVVMFGGMRPFGPGLSMYDSTCYTRKLTIYDISCQNWTSYDFYDQYTMMKPRVNHTMILRPPGATGGSKTAWTAYIFGGFDGKDHQDMLNITLSIPATAPDAVNNCREKARDASAIADAPKYLLGTASDIPKNGTLQDLLLHRPDLKSTPLTLDACPLRMPLDLGTTFVDMIQPGEEKTFKTYIDGHDLDIQFDIQTNQSTPLDFKSLNVWEGFMNMYWRATHGLTDDSWNGYSQTSSPVPSDIPTNITVGDGSVVTLAGILNTSELLNRWTKYNGLDGSPSSSALRQSTFSVIEFLAGDPRRFSGYYIYSLKNPNPTTLTYSLTVRLLDHNDGSNQGSGIDLATLGFVMAGFILGTLVLLVVGVKVRRIMRRREAIRIAEELRLMEEREEQEEEERRRLASRALTSSENYKNMKPIYRVVLGVQREGKMDSFGSSAVGFGSNTLRHRALPRAKKSTANQMAATNTEANSIPRLFLDPATSYPEDDRGSRARSDFIRDLGSSSTSEASHHDGNTEPGDTSTIESDGRRGSASAAGAQSIDLEKPRSLLHSGSSNRSSLRCESSLRSLDQYGGGSSAGVGQGVPNLEGDKYKVVETDEMSPHDIPSRNDGLNTRRHKPIRVQPISIEPLPFHGGLVRRTKRNFRRYQRSISRRSPQINGRASPQPSVQSTSSRDAQVSQLKGSLRRAKKTANRMAYGSRSDSVLELNLSEEHPEGIELDQFNNATTSIQEPEFSWNNAVTRMAEKTEYEPGPLLAMNVLIVFPGDTNTRSVTRGINPGGAEAAEMDDSFSGDNKRLPPMAIGTVFAPDPVRWWAYKARQQRDRRRFEREMKKLHQEQYPRKSYVN
ncbi:hypothetical protein BGX27_010036 [Mortierella sp. AM989]|nr:hypothetical protein BGX27_010036 [Mortierella sp. AM989]